MYLCFWHRQDCATCLFAPSIHNTVTLSSHFHIYWLRIMHIPLKSHNRHTPHVILLLYVDTFGDEISSLNLLKLKFVYFVYSWEYCPFSLVVKASDFGKWGPVVKSPLIKGCAMKGYILLRKDAVVQHLM